MLDNTAFVSFLFLHQKNSFFAGTVRFANKIKTSRARNNAFISQNAFYNIITQKIVN